MSFLPADSDAVLSIFRAGIVHLDHDEDVLELALDIGNERSGSRLLKSGNQIRPKIYLPIGSVSGSLSLRCAVDNKFI